MEVLILGTRGIPAQHGGFETFAQDLAVFLTARAHRVTVYCQSDIDEPLYEDVWNNLRRIHIFGRPGALGTISFDLAAVRHSLRQPGVVLILGYNTAVFSILFRLFKRISLMNMDGLEWKREKWSRWQRLWLRLNEYAGAKLSTHLIADHPAIGRHLEHLVAKTKITVIPYGADAIEDDLSSSNKILNDLNLHPAQYALVIARPEPENSLLEIVEAFSAKTRRIKLVVLGKLRPSENRYHADVLQAAGPEVIFPGAIYDKSLVSALRHQALLYLHGHRVGGTNPSLVEALAAGNAIIAHNNQFTRWVVGEDAQFFDGAQDLDSLLTNLLDDQDRLRLMRDSSRRRHLAEFTQLKVLSTYEDLLQQFAGRDRHAALLANPELR
jgi:glycosyltransferase involved in cell wall biosynthesis